ncbi:MAG: nucleotidyltransferase domain-containing protein [Patescibacteria group bacterium]
MLNLQSKIVNKVIGFFFINPQKRLYLKQLAEILDIDAGNLSRQIKKIEAEGIIGSENEGRQKHFYLNPDYPLLDEVKKIYETKYSLPLILKKTLASLEGLQEAYIFGSYAKNTMTAESDLDLLLVGNHDALEARRVILPLQKRIGREINMIDFSESEYQEKKAAGDDFIKNIFSGKFIKII